MINSDSVLSVNERVIIAIVAVILHIFFAIFLFIPVWERPIPAPEPAGITLISFGNVITPTETPAPSQSEFTPPITETQEQEQTPEVKDITPQKQTQTPDIHATKNENTVSVAETKKNKKEEKAEKKEEKKVEPKEEKKEVKQEEKTVPKEQTPTPVKEDKSNQTTSNSNEEGDSNSKDKQGNSGDPNDKGKIGTKEGTEISVVGWRWIQKPQPNDGLNEQGRIVYDITIDKNGDVTNVVLVEYSVGIGVATRIAYRNAVLNTKFERTLSKPATEPTVGRLTFTIKVGN